MSMLSPDIEARLETAQRLPSLPSVVGELLTLANDHDAPLTDFVELVAKDPALCLQLLKLANCPYYRRGGKPLSCHADAVARLGIDGTLTALLGFTLVRDAVRGPLKDYWRQTLATTHLTRAIATVLRPEHVTELTTQALLQDIGVLVLHGVDPDYFALIAEADDKGQRQSIERTALGCTREQASRWLVERWQLPHAVLARLEEDVDNEMTTHWLDVCCLRLANDLSRHCLAGDSAAIDASLHRFRLTTGLADETQLVLTRQLDDAMGTLPGFLAALLSPEEDIERLLLAGKQQLHGLTLHLVEQLHHRETQLTALKRDNEALDVKATTDALTGLANRAALEQRLGTMLHEAYSTNRPLSLLFIDLDHFKQLNDQYGHRIGDIVLVNVAATLRDAVRANDLAARYGGEEFVIALAGTPASGALEVARRIEQWLARQPMASVEQRPLQVTASIGVAQWLPEMPRTDAAALIAAADKQMYGAKASGRARIQHDSEASDQGVEEQI
ncbi:GGDEF domain-containing protein [Halomonas sp. DP8Y7-3]|nr:GGDEF domain-containing protein [Halomonas sp. DP8Y7-3]